MSNTVYLQGIGDTPAKMVSELSEGDVFIKNYGYKYKVLECSSLSSNTYELTFESLNSTDPGCRYTKHVRGSSLVGVDEDLRLLQQLHKAQKRATEKKRKEDEEKEKLRKQNQEISANRQVSGEFASSASEESTASKILTFMTERKLTKKEIKDRDEIADRLPSSEFKKRYSNPNPPARNWKDVMYATATNIAKMGESVEDDVVHEAIGDGKPKSKTARKMDIAVSKIDRMFRNKKQNLPGSARAKQRVNSAAFGIKMGRDPEEMKQSPYHTTQDVRSAQQFLKKVKEDINPKLKSFDLSGTGIDIPSINNKVYGTEGLKRGDGKTSTTGKDKKTGYEDPLKGYPYNK